MKRRKNISIIMAGILMSFVSFSSIHVSAVETEANDNFKVNVENVRDAEGKIYNHLEWTDLGKGYNYRVFQKGDNNPIYQSIPADKSAKILNIYPDSTSIPNTGMSGGQKDLDGYDVADSGILKTWLIKENIDDVNIDCVSLSAFNSNPSKYLRKVDGIWNYNSVFYGMWNLTPESIFPNDNAIEYLRSYINDGGGFMASHHTIGYRGLDKGVNKLAKEMGVEIFSTQPYSVSPLYAGTGSDGKLFDTVSFEELAGTRIDYSPYWVCGNKVEIVKNGLLLNYPFNVGKVGDVITIPYTTGLGIFAKGDVWMNVNNPMGYNNLDFKEISKSPATGEKGTNNFYVHTYNNTAIINSGHSFPKITKEETQIIANTLYYLSQITEETSCDAHIGQDVTAPEKPNINSVKLDKDNNKVNISLDAAKDLGTEYDYYVEATEKGTNNKRKSNEQNTTITSGVKGYSIVVDNNKDTVPKNEVTTSSTKYSVDNNLDGDFYVHVAAIDNADNISEVDTYKYSYPKLILSASEPDKDNTVTINAKVEGGIGGILEIDLPDGTKVCSNNYDYKVNTNGTYSFTVWDNDGNQVTDSIKVTTIPTEVNLNVYNSNKNCSVLEWSVLDDTQEYSYIANGKKSAESDYETASVNKTTYEEVNHTDVQEPTTPDITNVNIDKENNITTINFRESVDKGTRYDYFVEAVASESGVKSTSEIKTATMLSGLKEYYVLVDENTDTTPDGTITTTNNEFTFDKAYEGHFYVHVAAVDNAGNISEVDTYECNNPVLELSTSTSTSAVVKDKVVIKADASKSLRKVVKIITPDNKEVAGDKAQYTVDLNGEYSFTAIDENGNKTIKTIKVENIIPDVILNVEPNIMNKHLNEVFNVDLTINSINNIYATRVRIKYDSSNLEFLGFDQVKGVELTYDNRSKGELSFVLGSLNINNPMSGKSTIIKMKFKGTHPGKASIDVAKGRVADGELLEQNLRDSECGHAIVNIIDRELKNEYTLLDLSRIVKHYGDDPAVLLLQGIDADLNLDGKIDKEDYERCQELMINNPNDNF